MLLRIKEEGMRHGRQQEGARGGREGKEKGRGKKNSSDSVWAYNIYLICSTLSSQSH